MPEKKKSYFLKIYEQEMSKLYDQDLDLVSNIPVFASIRSSLYRSRYTTQSQLRESTNARGIVLSEDVLKMDDG